MKEENRMNKLMPRFSYRIVPVICVGLLLSGCVMAEKYEAEKARSLNFQRLLAQEEKRTSELDNEARRSKSELMEFEARNRELTAQIQAVREQAARAQEEAEAMKESALLERKAKADMKRPVAPGRKTRAVEPLVDITDTVDLSASDLGLSPESSSLSGLTESSQGGLGAPTTHVVKAGETLYRISRQYGVSVDKVKKWNKLQDNTIEIGQKLIVGQ